MQCKNTPHVYFEEHSKQRFKTDTAYTQFVTDAKSFEEETEHFLWNIENLLQNVEKINGNAFNKFTKYKTLVIAYLDKREKELLVELKSIRDQDVTRLEELKATAETMQTYLREAQTTMRMHEYSTNDLFIATKRARALLTKLQSSFIDIRYRSGNHHVGLQIDPLVKTLLARDKGFAHVITIPGNLI